MPSTQASPPGRRHIGLWATQAGGSAQVDLLTGNPGGEPGWIRKPFTADFLTEFHRHFRLEGRRVIAKVAKQQPAAYLRCLTMLVPKEMKLEHQAGIKAMSDEQLDEALAALRQLLADREAAARGALEARDVVPPLSSPEVIDAEPLETKDN